MRSIVSRLARLERQQAEQAPQRIVIQHGYLKKLPAAYSGPRHVVTVRQIPPDELSPANCGEIWFEWEERPGPGPAESAERISNDLIISVCYVEEERAAWRLNG